MMRIESKVFSLRELLYSIKTMFTSRIQAKDLSFDVNVENSTPDLLIGDAIRLTQILVNLVNNAIKFTEHGGIEIIVKADKKTGDKTDISFSVKDTGIGIASHKMEAIFERFQQADEDTTRKYGGTGLGLTIVKQLVALQNGNLQINSELNKGTEFIFSIPYAISNEPAEHDEPNAFAAGEIKLDDTHLKILVAEDNVMNQNLMRHLLSQWNLDFDLVNNGKEAIEALQQKDYKLLLMDIQMPLMDGYTATMKIRNELRQNIPIIAMTAHAMAGEKEKCLSFGMNEYISKPIREKELLNIINNLLAKSELLDLNYLKEVSGGNSEFETDMIEQFLQQAPGELEAMKEAFNKRDNNELSHLAHNFKTSVSFMGLSKKLDQYLDYIETNAGIRNLHENIGEKIVAIHTVCQKAFQEARDYLQCHESGSGNKSFSKRK